MEDQGYSSRRRLTLDERPSSLVLLEELVSGVMENFNDQFNNPNLRASRRGRPYAARQPGKRGRPSKAELEARLQSGQILESPSFTPSNPPFSHFSPPFSQQSPPVTQGSPTFSQGGQLFSQYNPPIPQGSPSFPQVHSPFPLDHPAHPHCNPQFHQDNSLFPQASRPNPQYSPQVPHTSPVPQNSPTFSMKNPANDQTNQRSSAQMPLHSAAYSVTEPGNYQHLDQPELNSSYTRNRLREADWSKRQKLRQFYKRAQGKEPSSPYMRPDQRSTVQPSPNQILYPNISIVPRTTATVMVPEQLPQFTSMNSMNEQSSCRYNTRSAAHKKQLRPVSNLESCWNANASGQPGCHTPVGHTTHQMCPQPHAGHPQMRAMIHNYAQTEIKLKDFDKFFNVTHAMRMDTSQISVTKADDEYIVTYNETSDNDNLLNSETMESLVKNSEVFKNAFALVAEAYQGISGIPPMVNPAIEYNCPQANTPSTSGTNISNFVTLPNPQEELEELIFSTDEATDSDEVNQNAANTTSPQMQMPYQRNISPEIQQGYPIPSIYNQNFNSPSIRPGPEYSPGLGRPHSSQTSGPNLNVPLNLLQNSFQQPNMFMDPRFVPPDVDDEYEF